MKVSEIPGIEMMDKVRVFIAGEYFDTRISDKEYILSVDIRSTDWQYDQKERLLRIWI